MLLFFNADLHFIGAKENDFKFSNTKIRFSSFSLGLQYVCIFDPYNLQSAEDASTEAFVVNLLISLLMFIPTCP